MDSLSKQQHLNDLFSLIYEELKRLARSVLRREYTPVELSPTTLVHEAWIKLSASPRLATTSPLHFRNIAARAMRQILVDAARRRKARIHGGGLVRVDIDLCLEMGKPMEDREIIALDDALDLLNKQEPRLAQVVEARYFGGLTCAECAELFGFAEETIQRDWRIARAWLVTEIRGTLQRKSNQQEGGATHANNELERGSAGL
ncbi:ECF-type sigma factor [Terriglobus roseus]|uniref:RNA polymerase, sigma subunit, ECF family n=1 Tax=Terriglobus roseus TaxID=392734 RepID=A0A1H4NSI0_9BACT|nr:ECF-type sigma factor [Terriglobus roseus]SEB97788.1 RNA polymerase, sigma subunit, ECF family [Terriglobus roseus]